MRVSIQVGSLGAAFSAANSARPPSKTRSKTRFLRSVPVSCSPSRESHACWAGIILPPGWTDCWIRLLNSQSTNSGSGGGTECLQPFLILRPGQTGEACFVQDLSDSGSTQGSLLAFQGSFDVVDGKVLLAYAKISSRTTSFLSCVCGPCLRSTKESGLDPRK